MFNLLKDTFREWREDGANRLAAALVYYTSFSLAKLIGAVTLRFGALEVFGERQNSLNRIWEIRPKPATNFMSPAANRSQGKTSIYLARESPTVLQNHPPLLLVLTKFRMFLDRVSGTKFSLIK